MNHTFALQFTIFSLHYLRVRYFFHFVSFGKRQCTREIQPIQIRELNRKYSLRLYKGVLGQLREKHRIDIDVVLRLLCFKYKIKIFLYGYKVIFHLCSFQIADSQLFFNQFLLIYKRVFCLVLFPISQCIMSLQNSSPAPRYLTSLSIRTNLHKNLVGRYLLQIHPLLIFRYIRRKYTCFSYRQFNG